MTLRLAPRPLSSFTTAKIRLTVCTARSSCRLYHISAASANKLLQKHNFRVNQDHGGGNHALGIAVNREARSPCLVAWRLTKPETVVRIPFDYASGPQKNEIDQCIAQIDWGKQLTKDEPESLQKLSLQLWDLYKDTNAIHLSVEVEIDGSQPTVSAPKIMFDDAAVKVGKQNQALYELRDTITSIASSELEAEKYGIIYVPLEDTDSTKHRNIGTLVNGAGLAMNTIDALAKKDLNATNFMDTGGLATSDTVAAGFSLLLRDPRVELIFVNVFGGLTNGDMIANGIVMAFKQVDVTVPVVVRIRGTREAEGAEVIKNSGLALWAVREWEDATLKIKELLAKKQ
jgi:succinyl-CoA synthetase alpha subunit